ncbi:hypothetical protein [Rahnella aquatilis]|uniref:hypothetical protein n=1 Tax=Rahnella aquatilis TaxID=34038 RepID=UPI00068B376E|nr:hypothetical protein [Rahnella aquatilis]
MSQWKLYPPLKKREKFRFPWLAILLIYIVVIAVAVLIRALFWPDNKSVEDIFFLQAVVVPFFIITTCLCYAGMFLSVEEYYYDVKRQCVEWDLYYLKKFAQRHLVIGGWTSVSPVDNLAVQLLKLEGQFPLAPKTPQRIKVSEGFDETKLQCIFNSLIEPLTDKLIKRPDVEIIYWLRDGDDTSTEELGSVLDKNGIKIKKDITRLPECPDYSFLDTMINESVNQWQYSRLFIIADLCNDETVKSMESATALFICKEYPANEKPKPVYLYQPLTGDADLADSVPVYLAVEQTTPPKTLWHTGLAQTEKYPLLNALSECKMAAERVDLELAFGEYTVGYGWLALAVASDAARYGQGAQLMAASEKGKPALTVISAAQPSTLKAPEGDHVAMPLFWSFPALVMSIIAFVFSWGVYFGVPEGWSVIIFIVIMLLITLGLGGLLTRFAVKSAENDVQYPEE